VAYGAAETAPRPSARRMAVRNHGCAARTLLEDLPEIDDQLSSADRVAERCRSLATAFDDVAPKRLSVVPSTKWGLERETGSRTRDIQLGRPRSVSAVAPCSEARAYRVQLSCRRFARRDWVCPIPRVNQCQLLGATSPRSRCSISRFRTETASCASGRLTAYERPVVEVTPRAVHYGGCTGQGSMKVPSFEAGR